MTLNKSKAQTALACATTALVITIALGLVQSRDVYAQGPTNTPLVFSIPLTSTPQAEVTEEALTVATVSSAEASFDGPMLQAIQSANVRAEGDINAQRIGEIVNGDLYPITGRAFRWLRIQFDASPTGVGWVYDELVEIIGDESAIPDLTVVVPPTENASVVGPTQTIDALSQTAGGIETATASARFLDAPQGPAGSNLGQGGSAGLDVEGPGQSGPLPTFTFPASIVALAPTEQAPASGIAPIGDTEPLEPTSDLAPIAPISILIGIGLAGLIISATRR